MSADWTARRSITLLMNAAALLIAGAMSQPSAAFAGESPSCTSRITRSNVVPCVLAASLTVRAEEYELEAAEGRKQAVSHFLPSNPLLSLSAARRAIPGQATVSNWDATLSQEIEIAGQRGKRRDAAQAEIESGAKRVLLSRRDAAVAAWVAFFDAATAGEEQRLAARLDSATQAVAAIAHARADRGLLAPVDADVADAASLRVFQAKLAADRRLAGAEASLASLLGLEPARSSIALFSASRARTSGRSAVAFAARSAAAASTPARGISSPST